MSNNKSGIQLVDKFTQLYSFYFFSVPKDCRWTVFVCCSIRLHSMSVEERCIVHGVRPQSVVGACWSTELDSGYTLLSCSFASLNYLSPFLPLSCSTPVGQMGIEASSHCCIKIDGRCLLRSLWNCISVWRPGFLKKLLLYSVFPIALKHKRAPARIFFQIYNNSVQQQLREERKSINCGLSPSRPSAQVPESR